MSAVSFNATTTADEAAHAFADMINNKTVLIMGVSPGSLGSEVARVIAQHKPRLIVLGGRKQPKLRQTEDAILKATPSASLRSLVLDLSSLEQVRAAAAEVNSYAEPIDVLINSAGIMAVPCSQTVDGFESQFGTNHLGPFLFTNLIMPKLLAAPAGARVVVVSSDGHAFQQMRFDDPNWSDKAAYHPWKAYGQAKTANVLFAKALGRKLKSKGVSAYSLHPGVIQTNLGGHLGENDWKELMALKSHVFQNAKKTGRESKNVHTDPALAGTGLKYKTLPQGAATHIVAAFSPDILKHSGEYLQDCQIETTAREPFAADSESSEKLWSLSEGLVGQEFSY